MTIEFWAKRHRTPRPKPKPAKTPTKPTWRKPKLPIGVGKAQQMLSSAIICGNHEKASWVYLVTMQKQVTGKPGALRELQKRLDTVMAPVAAS